MVQLKAKGRHEFVEANVPMNVARLEVDVVLSSLRTAVDALVNMATHESKSSTSEVLNQVLVLKKLLADITSEAEEMELLVRAVETRIMDL